MPLGTVGALEFLGPLALAASGARHWRNIAALALAIGGVYLLTDIRLAHEAFGYLFAFANCALFTLFIMLGHRIAKAGGTSIDRLALAMLIAMIAGLPFGIAAALRLSMPCRFSWQRPASASPRRSFLTSVINWPWRDCHARLFRCS